MSRRSDPLQPACVGKYDLFDATDIESHRNAAALCATCPMIVGCRDLLRLAREEPCGSPSGTWAGELIAPARTSIARMDEEEAMFSGDVELRAVHAAYVRGERDERTLIGERVYKRIKARGRDRSVRREVA